MKLEVGMYVRNDYFGIGKINRDYFDNKNKHWFNVQFNCYEDEDNHCGICEESIGYKASHNIIDLIEVGDILEINGEKYEVIYDESYEKLGILIPSRKELSIRHSALEYVFKKYEVAIVTKEQFGYVSYKIEV